MFHNDSTVGLLFYNIIMVDDLRSCKETTKIQFISIYYKFDGMGYIVPICRSSLKFNPIRCSGRKFNPFFVAFLLFD